MANDTTGNRCWTLDTVGIISHTPVKISKIQFIPAADGNALKINSYARHSVISGSRVDNVLGTIANTNTLTAAGGTPFSTDIDDGDVVEILASNGDAANIGRFLTTANTTTTVITCAGQLTNEASKIYSLQAYKAVMEVYTVADGTGIHEIDFSSDPLSVPSFILETLGGGTVVVYLA